MLDGRGAALGTVGEGSDGLLIGPWPMSLSRRLISSMKNFSSFSIMSLILPLCFQCFRFFLSWAIDVSDISHGARLTPGFGAVVEGYGLLIEGSTPPDTTGSEGVVQVGQGASG